MKWTIASGVDKDVIIAQAIKLGWAENKVQVRKELGEFGMYYFIEPHEEDCGCPNLLRYQDFAPIKADIEG